MRKWQYSLLDNILETKTWCSLYGQKYADTRVTYSFLTLSTAPLHSQHFSGGWHTDRLLQVRTLVPRMHHIIVHFLPYCTQIFLALFSTLTDIARYCFGFFCHMMNSTCEAFLTFLWKACTGFFTAGTSMDVDISALLTPKLSGKSGTEVRLSCFVHIPYHPKGAQWGYGHGSQCLPF